MEKIEDVLITKEGHIVLNNDLISEVSQWGNKLKAYKNGRIIIIAPAGNQIDTNHPFITSYDDICGGEPVLIGTRVTVRAIVEYYKLYGDVESILQSLPHLSKAQVEDALGYYADHSEEIDHYIAENDETLQQKLYQELLTNMANRVMTL